MISDGLDSTLGWPDRVVKPRRTIGLRPIVVTVGQAQIRVLAHAVAVAACASRLGARRRPRKRPAYRPSQPVVRRQNSPGLMMAMP